MKEDVLQSNCWQKTWKQYPDMRRCIWHVPNGGARTKVQAAQFTGMGVVAGVSDVHIIWQTQFYIIEFKVDGYFITDKQEQYIRAATKQGAIFYECRSEEKWDEIIKGILELKPLPCEEKKLVQIRKDCWKIAN